MRHDRKPALGESAPWIVRTALCVEPREGRLHVFMPPVSSIEDFVDLLAAIEDTAAHLQMPVVIEGYTPPFDPRIGQIKVTPDPGVIEVNINPAHSWRELVANTTALYEEARQCRLGTEKFMLDGRHSGTGGGNHFVLGGRDPGRQPVSAPSRPAAQPARLLAQSSRRCPTCFRACSSGPPARRRASTRPARTASTSWRSPSARFPNPGEGYCPPWLVDRIFRHILVDVTGNTHRAEFCIDKLYSPDTATGRLGLLELRGFEMPPHARMSLTQQLLVRALVAWFWREPLRAEPIHWGTQLHDQFMLPHFVGARLRRRPRGSATAPAIAFETGWFAPHFEFRYPVFGRVSHMGIELELRQAIEPWYVLGEEPGAGGTARYVDSSVERLQVKVGGLTGERYVVTCNGRRLPLHSTGTQGEFVAGVRYRAWQPPSCLHPTIPVHTPLVFDIVDTWTGRSVGGCTYHVAHPGGRSYETFPVNANEAEARRAAPLLRLRPHAGTDGACRRAEDNPQFSADAGSATSPPAGTAATAAVAEPL